MAYIIAHGTVNGYQKIQNTLSDNRELQILTDIRTEFDNTSSMLTKSEGYLLQMSPSGVWVSIVKTLMDGERSGGGAGFFAFSAFIPKEQMIAGQQLKKVLDKLMQHYLSLCPNFMTRNINVDWSFVTNASAELNVLSQPRRKTIDTHYTPSNNFAYVQATTEEQIIQLLDKPFQPEYGKYTAVFLGTHLQHPMRLTQQICLNIDLENEEYDIIWNGNVNGWNNLPYKVRKKEINSGSYTFKKDYYNPTTIPYLSGERDDANTTLILDVPNLQPQINQITLQYSLPGASIVVGVTNLPVEQIKGTTLIFKGEEFTKTWEIYPVPLSDEYKFDKFSLTPCDCQNGIYPVNIIKMQHISLQILEDNKNQTSGWWRALTIQNKHTKANVTLSSPKGNTLSILIPEGENFSHDYKISLKSSNEYSIDDTAYQISNSLYHVNINKKQTKSIEIKPSNTRTIYLDVPERIDIKDLSATLNNGKLQLHNKSVKVANEVHSDQIRFSYKNVPLKSKCAKEDNSKIKLTLTLWGFIKLNLKPILLVAGIALLFSLIVFGALMLFKGIDIKGWFTNVFETECFDPERANNGTPSTARIDSGTINDDQHLYNELESILEIQREQWNYTTITELVGKYSDTKAKDSTHCAYKLYKELVWMQCRNRLNGYYLNDTEKKWYPYTKYKGKLSWIQGIENYGVNHKNSKYANPELKAFLQQILNAQDTKQKQFFETYVITKEVEKMTFDKVKNTWDNFTPRPPKDANPSNKNLRPNQPTTPETPKTLNAD